MTRGAWVVLPLLAACRPDPCPSCDEPAHHGDVASAELSEISGVAASRRSADIVYVHNDAGDRARFFALGLDGSLVATYEVDGAENEDWEDVASARCGDRDCLYIADLGDNDLVRLEYAIYVVDEPAEIVHGVHTLLAQRVRFTYPDGPHDAEVLLVHPVTGEVTIVTKVDEGPAAIYELGAPTPGAELVARRTGELAEGALTGGAIHPDATGILLRTKTRLFHWTMAPDETATEALRGDPCELELADEVHGEAVAWLRDGDGIVTIGEGAHAAVNVARCS